MATAEMEMPTETRPRGRSAWSRCDQAVARIAPISTTTCQVCGAQIAQGAWQLGLMFIHVEGFMLMEWYHLQCAKRMPGAGLAELIETVQTEMTPEQKQDFCAAFNEAAAGA